MTEMQPHIFDKFASIKELNNFPFCSNSKITNNKIVPE